MLLTGQILNQLILVYRCKLLCSHFFLQLLNVFLKGFPGPFIFLALLLTAFQEHTVQPPSNISYVNANSNDVPTFYQFLYLIYHLSSPKRNFLTLHPVIILTDVDYLFKNTKQQFIKRKANIHAVQRPRENPCYTRLRDE